MRPLVSKLVLAALVAAVLPAVAVARDCDRPAAYAPPDPHAAPAPGWRDDRRPWRDGSWRQRELAQVRAEMRDLETRRAQLYARPGWRPGQVRKFERWYASRRAELERRYWELQRVAWR